MTWFAITAVVAGLTLGPGCLLAVLWLTGYWDQTRR